MGTLAAGIIDTAWEIIDTVWECIICAITNSIIWIKVNVSLMYSHSHLFISVASIARFHSAIDKLSAMKTIK